MLEKSVGIIVVVCTAVLESLWSEEEEESGRRGVVLFKECWRVVNSAEVGGGVVAVLWHDVGRLCRFLFGRCYRELCGGGLRARCPA